MSLFKEVQTYIILRDDSDRYIVELSNDIIPQGTGIILGNIEFLEYKNANITLYLKQLGNGKPLTERRADIFGTGTEYQSLVTLQIICDGLRFAIIVRAVDGLATKGDEQLWTDQSIMEEELRCAILEGDFEAWEILLDRGVDVTASDHDGLTALHFAAAANWDDAKALESSDQSAAKVKQRIELVNRLLHAGADVNKNGWQGWTPLHDAACNWNPEIARIMLR